MSRIHKLSDFESAVTDKKGKRRKNLVFHERILYRMKGLFFWQIDLNRTFNYMLCFSIQLIARGVEDVQLSLSINKRAFDCI